MHPILRFHGAAHGVTGSCYEIETGDCRLLVDCGLFQGSKSEKELNYGDFPFTPRRSTRSSSPMPISITAACFQSW